MQRGSVNNSNRMSRRENNRVVFERLWRGSFQSVNQRRVRSSSVNSVHTMSEDNQPNSHEHSSNSLSDLEPALRTLLAGLRQPCCCRCSCSSTRYNNLQVCPSEDERKSMRSVIRYACWILIKFFRKFRFTTY